METPRRLKVFLCHTSGDKPAVRELYHRLRAEGFNPWLDEEKLLPGQDWQLEIPQAVRSSDAVVICLSRRAVTKAGYVQKEIRYALDVADEQPEGAIFLIPLRLEECEVPQRLRRWQWEDLFREQGYERLVRALRARARSLGLDRRPFEPEMVLIPAGEFLMGGDPAKDKMSLGDEWPQHTLYLPDFCLSRAPVTNAQYAVFVQGDFFRPPIHWEGGKPPRGGEDHPVVNVSWQEAMLYCEWLSEVTRRPYRLPSEAEWEKGARGTDGRIYPWGDEWDPERCNSGEGSMGYTVPVGAYPGEASPYGLLDMAGNVWEWTRSLWGENWERPHFGYPYDPRDGREDLEAAGLRVVRGGAWSSLEWYARCTSRLGKHPDYFRFDIGFRVAFPGSPVS
jgi:formylglycine-generating enzyme required for sulfatase activity